VFRLAVIVILSLFLLDDDETLIRIDLGRLWFDAYAWDCCIPTEDMCARRVHHQLLTHAE